MRVPIISVPFLSHSLTLWLPFVLNEVATVSKHSAPKEYEMTSALEHHKEIHYNDDNMSDTQAPPLFDSIGYE